MAMIAKRFLAIVVCVTMMFTTSVFRPADLQKTVMADEEGSVITAFSYDFAYTTPGYADGTIRISASEDGVYKVFWGDAEGNKLTKDGYEYSYLARVIVKDGKGSYNIISDYTVIPEDAKTVLVYKKDLKQYEYDISSDKLFTPSGEGYTFGALSDLHYGRYSTVYEDDAVPASDNAFKFLDSIGIDFVGITGDLTSEGEQTSLDKYNAAFAKYPNMTVLSCTGNHDSRTTVSTSDTSKLDTSLTRWYNTLTSTYFTVNEDGTYTSNLGDKYTVSAIGTPIATEYREAAGEEPQTKEIPALDLTVTDGDNAFIFLNEISKTGTTYDVDKLLTTAQLDWLAEQLEANKSKNVFLFAHSYLPVNTLNNDVVDNDNCTGDLKNNGGYSYDLDFKDEITTTDGRNILALLEQYSNVTMLSGHSHWQYAMQEINQGLNIGKLDDGNGATLVHISSVTEPRYIGTDDTGRTELNGYASEGSTVTIYDDCIVYNGIDFYNSQYEAYATYIVPLGDDSQFKPVKDTTYQAATDVISGDEYLGAEDMTLTQLLKSDYNLVYGSEYTQSSVGSEDTAGALTNGKNSGGYMNTEMSASAKKQEVIIDMGKGNKQPVNNIDYLLLYSKDSNTNATHFTVSVSLDGETYDTIGTYSNVDVATTHFDVDLSEVTLEEFRYVKLNFTNGNTNWGYQIREFAVIGVNPIEYPEIEDQSANVASVTKNFALNKPVIVSSTQDKEGSSDPITLTDGTKDTSHWSSGWDYKQAYVIIDLGQDVHTSSIGSVLVNFKSDNTYSSNYTIEFSKTYNEEDQAEGFYEVAKTKASSWEILQKKSDSNGYIVTEITDVEPDTVRYVKINMDGIIGGWGFQVYEIAVLAKEKKLTSSEANISIENTEYTYTGSAIKPEITATFAGQELVEGTDYSVTYTNNINAGTATYKVTGMGNCTETATGTFTINPADLIVATVNDSQLKNFEFEGKDKTPIITISHNGKKLNMHTDYVVKYENNFYPGTATITITGIGNYKGEIVRTFNIVKKAIGNVTINTSFDANKNLVVKVNNGSYAMTKDVDYKYTVVTDAAGNITITLTGIGNNYSGTVVKKIAAKDNPNRPIPTVKAPGTAKIKKITTKKKSSKKVKLSLKRLTNAKGYEVAIYTTKKNANKNKKALVKKTYTKINITINSKKLKNKKSLYVRVRAYNLNADGTKAYGKWSKVKRVKIKK